MSLYKVLAKILANRLRKVIGGPISDTQSAFISGKQILDDILIANEVVGDARNNKKEFVASEIFIEARRRRKEESPLMLFIPSEERKN